MIEKFLLDLGVEECLVLSTARGKGLVMELVGTTLIWGSLRSRCGEEPCFLKMEEKKSEAWNVICGSRFLIGRFSAHRIFNSCICYVMFKNQSGVPLHGVSIEPPAATPLFCIRIRWCSCTYKSLLDLVYSLITLHATKHINFNNLHPFLCYSIKLKFCTIP